MQSSQQLGHVGRQPELRFAGETPKCTFSVASNRRFTDRETGETKEVTTWINYEIWGKTAETFAKIVKSGHMVYVESHLRNEEWVDKETGEKRYRDKHVVDYWKLCERKAAQTPDAAEPEDGFGEAAPPVSQEDN